MKKNILLFSIFGIAVACSTMKNSNATSDIERGQKLYPGYTLAELNEGKNLYEAKCSTCHKLVKISHESPEGWKKMVPKMSELSNKKGKAISVKEENLILKYVVTMSSK